MALEVHKTGAIPELLALPDEVVFAELTANLTLENRNFIPFDSSRNPYHGAFISVEDAAEIFPNPKVDRVAAFNKAIKGGKVIKVKAVEFAQRRAEVKVHKNGKIVVTRKLRVRKRDDPEGILVMLVCPGLGGLVLEFPSQMFHNAEDFKSVGEYLEKSEEEEMGPAEFSEFMEVWRANAK